MIDIILKNLATTYYPIGICAFDEFEKYTNTFEYKNLTRKVNSAFSLIRQNGINKQILEELKKNENIKEIEDVTLESSDRCLTYKVNFFEGNVLYQLCLNLSIIVPYYNVYVLKNNFELEPYRWLNLPERDKESEIDKFESSIKFISNIIEQKFLFNKFPDNLINTIIPDINYADVELGNFTYFNAFFLDDLKL